MKLLAVAAIGVIACLGTPDEGFGKSWPKTECAEIDESARTAYYNFSENSKKLLEIMKRENVYIFTKPLEPQKSVELADLGKRRDELNKQPDGFRTSAALWAQVHSACCK